MDKIDSMDFFAVASILGQSVFERSGDRFA